MIQTAMPLLARRPTIASSARLPFAAVVLLSALTVHAASPAAPPAPPAPRPTQSQVLQSPYGLTEIGLLDGAAYRIDVPTNWNHSLVVFYHGYALQPVSFHVAARLTAQQIPFFERHYAIAQSAYSETGWALQQAYPETESLRRYFTRKYGQPLSTYVAGRSMGGDLVSITLEINPRPYLGGLDFCGSVGPAYQFFERRFAMRAAFDHYFPDVMPPLVPVPADYGDTIADRDKVLAALRANPANATLMRNLTGLHSDLDLAHDIAYWTFLVGDMQRRGGGNPLDNRNYIYSGTSPTSSASDLELNDKVKRYTAVPHARAYLVPVSQLALYDREVQAAGAGENLVQQIVDREGHCNFTQNEIGDAFDEMVRWAHGGPRPAPGVLKQ
jgi:hypothetical protein